MGKKETKLDTEKSLSIVKKIITFLTDQRTKYGIGIILLVFTAYLALSFISFFFTGAADDSLIQNSFFELSAVDKKEICNWSGPMGAYIANLFINKGFGIASFSFLFLFFFLALRLMKVRLMRMWKAIVSSILSLVWFSTAIAFFFSPFYTNETNFILWGGAHGESVGEWLKLNVGWFGTFLILISSFLIFSIILYKGTIPFLQSVIRNLKNKIVLFFKKKEKNLSESDSVEELTEEPTETEVEELEEEELEDEPIAVENEETEVQVEEETEELEKVNVEDEPQVEEIKEQAEDLEKEETDEWIISSDVDEEFEIVVAKDDNQNTETSEADTVKEVDIDELGEYDPTLDLSNFMFPTLDLLKDYGATDGQVNVEEQNANKNRIITTLKNYGIEIESIKATVGPTITLYEIVPKAGVRISKIRNLESDIMLSLAAIGIRIIAPIPGKGTIGIEVPNNDPQIVSMHSVIASKKFQDSKYGLPIAFGRTITNEVFMVDLCKMPHMLVAGATGQGKSVGLNAIITSLLYKKHPAYLKFVLVDPKKVEFNIYSKIEKHYLAKLPDEEEAIITDVTKVVQTLNSLTKEMDDRYDLLKKAHVRNLSEYNEKFIKRKLNPEKGHRFLPYIVVIVDEFGDLIMVAGKEVEMPIARIAQLARAVGIHMILATQRPSVNIITGVIKANFPARVAFRVSSQIDSRTILDATGANQLVGRGDMLFSQGSDLVRVQCAFVDTPEVERVSDFIGDQRGYPDAFMLPEYTPEGGEGSDVGGVDLSKRDAMFEDAARMVVANQQGSTSMIQRKFSIGYNRAGRIMDQLEAAGIVGPFEGSKARQVLVPDDYSLEQKLQSL